VGAGLSQKVGEKVTKNDKAAPKMIYLFSKAKASQKQI
jgi:hypothetical protein